MAKKIDHEYSSIIDRCIDEMFEQIDEAIADDYHPYDEENEEMFFSLTASARKYVKQQIDEKLKANR